MVFNTSTDIRWGPLPWPIRTHSFVNKKQYSWVGILMGPTYLCSSSYFNGSHPHGLFPCVYLSICPMNFELSCAK